MADGLTTPRKLEQIYWHKGITDGDIRPGFFSELLNVEMDETARLRTRDGLVAESVSVPTAEPCKFIHINSDPSSRNADGWNMFLTRYTVYIFPYGEDIGHVDAATITLPYEVDLETIETVILGSNVIISSCSPDGDCEPNPVISIVWNPTVSKFSPPSYIDSGDDIYGQIETDGGWGVLAYNRTPELFIEGANRDEMNSKLFRRQCLARLESSLASNTENGVGIYVTTREKDTISKEGMGYTDRAVVRFVAVFVYSDGSLSLPSNEKTYTADFGDTTAEFDICVAPMVHEDCFRSIVGVRIYRKIIEGVPSPSPNFDFLMYAPLYDDGVHEETFRVPAFADGNRDLIKVDDSLDFTDEEASDNYRYNENEQLAGLMQYQVPSVPAGWHQNSSVFAERIAYSHKFADETVKYTAGWIKAKSSSSVMLYMPPHWYQEGQMISVFRHHDSNNDGDPNTDGHGTGLTMRVPFTGGNIRITDRIQSGGDDNDKWRVNNFEFIENCVIIGSHISPPVKATGNRLNLPVMYRFPNTNFDGSAVDPKTFDYDLIGYRGMFRMGSTLPALASVEVEVLHFWFTYPTISVGSTPTDEKEGFERTFAAWRDKGKNQNLPSIEEEFGGIEASEISTVKPRHIGAAGGRLFGLNIIENDEEQPSKLMYTEFGNFAVFRRDNYIDYGVRDDGIGMAVSNLKSYVIAHHSSSTYVFDISGGSDFVWREVGAYKDVGLYGSKLIASTPFGVFWCDRNHVWFYDGRQPVPVTTEIMNTYRDMIPNIERMLYKEDLKQIWLVPNDGSDVYVFDIDGNRWHTHKLTEHNENTRLHDSIYNVGHDMFINIVDRSYLNHDFYKFSRVSTEPFTWRFDTGRLSMQMPEVIKKMRRLYCHMVRDAAYSTEDQNLKIRAIGGSSGNITIQDDLVINDEQIRVSTSVRGYHVQFVISVEAGEFWRGSMESLGVSYKVKKLK